MNLCCFLSFLKDSLWINISIIKANLVLEVAPDFVFSFLFIFVLKRQCTFFYFNVAICAAI